ncbi:hypothetical protein, partial [Streptomyces sp. NPDC003832]
PAYERTGDTRSAAITWGKPGASARDFVRLRSRAGDVVHLNSRTVEWISVKGIRSVPGCLPSFSRTMNQP